MKKVKRPVINESSKGTGSPVIPGGGWRYRPSTSTEQNKPDIVVSSAPKTEKFYVYVIDIQNKLIAFALSCPDKKTGKQARERAIRELGHDGSKYAVFQSGVTPVDSSVTIKIESLTTPRLRFSIDDFDSAVLQTREYLLRFALDGIGCNESYEKIFAFMRSVDKALVELTRYAVRQSRLATPSSKPVVIPVGLHDALAKMQFTPGIPACFPKRYTEAESSEPIAVSPAIADSLAESEPADDIDVADMVDKTKGRWVLQKEFIDPTINANRSNFATRTLKRDREEGNYVLSKKNPKVGRDAAGNFFERYKGKCRNSYRYKYILLNKHDLTMSAQVTRGH